MPGAALAWFVGSTRAVYAELYWLSKRPVGMPLFVILPEPEEVVSLVEILRLIPALKPKGVLPGAGAASSRRCGRCW